MEYDFEWSVSNAGYRSWHVQSNEPVFENKEKHENWDQFIVELDRNDSKTYNPMEIDNLFLKFANTQATSEGAVRFASKYGLLGQRPTAVSDESGNFNTHRLGEPMVTWIEELHEMRQAVDLISALKRRDAQAVVNNPLVLNAERLLEGSLGIMDPELQLPIRPLMLRNPPSSQELKHGYDFAYNCLVMTVNRKIRHISPKLIRLAHSNQFAMKNMPRNLLGAMWLQFAKYLAGAAEIVSCLICGNQIVIKPGSSRRGVRYCSDACKMRAYRQRHAEAKEIDNSNCHT